MSITEKVNVLRGTETSKKIFIIGTGRSGTHFIAYVLENSPEIRATIEARFVFRRVKEIAANPDKFQTHFPNLVNYYRFQHFLSAPLHYLDKSHPNIWLAEELEETFNDALFIGIVRNPFATIASMLRHNGVLSWFDRWKEYPVPNRFLGIDDSNKHIYDDFSLSKKCALRWNAHLAQMKYLEKRLGDRMLVIRYESLIRNTTGVVEKIADFINLSTSIPPPKNVKTSSLDKWKKQLGEDKIEKISQVTGVSLNRVEEYYHS